MIIQLRGTSGSGKTTAMRKFMQDAPRGYHHWQSVFVSGRRKPQFYHLGDHVAVLGHYDSPCGGCDTFKGYEQLQAAVRVADSYAEYVVMEGLMLSDDVLQTAKMHTEVAPVKVIYLTTDIELCIERVKQRRAARGKDGIFNYDKLRNRHEQIMRTRPRLEAAGIYCRRASANQTPQLVLDWLRA